MLRLQLQWAEEMNEAPRAGGGACSWQRPEVTAHGR